MTIAMTVGTFAPLHRDHEELFSWMGGLANRVMVGINSKELVMTRKGFDPGSYWDREEKVQETSFVDYTFEFMGGSLLGELEMYRPDFLVIGSDYHDKHYMDLIEVSFEDLHRLGCFLVYKPTLERIHSSELRGES